MPEHNAIEPEKDWDFDQEPARAIARVKKLWLGVAGILTVFGIAMTPELNDSIDLLIQGAIGTAYGVYAIWQAHRQGEQTRASVYAPETVERMVGHPVLPTKKDTDTRRVHV